MTIGDVLAVLAAIAATATTWAAMLLVFILVAPQRVATAQSVLAASPRGAAARGVLVTAIGGLFAFVLGQNPNGIIKALALLVLAGLGLLAAVGSAGIVMLMSERIGDHGPGLPLFAARTRASILYVLAGFFPIAGWLFVTPAALLISIGAGAAAMMPAKKIVPAIPPRPETVMDANL